MILADTSVWFDHFRQDDRELRKLLMERSIVMHPYIVAELSLGSMPQRAKTLTLLDQLPSARVALLGEVRHMIEARVLHGRGIGLTDAHLLASTFLHASTLLWTRDRRLRTVAESLGIHANLA